MYVKQQKLVKDNLQMKIEQEQTIRKNEKQIYTDSTYTLHLLTILNLTG